MNLVLLIKGLDLEIYSYINFINDINMESFTKKIFDYRNCISSIYFRITYPEYILELIDFHCIIWFCELNYDNFYDLLNKPEYIYNIKCKKANIFRFLRIDLIKFNLILPKFIYHRIERKW
jgi:hypothetical protein